LKEKHWKPPIYRRVRKLPFIPSETEIDQLIAATSPRISTYFQLLKETGMRCGEASQLKWTDIDFISRLVRITPEKGSNPQILPISIKLIDMLNTITKDILHVKQTLGHKSLDNTMLYTQLIDFKDDEFYCSCCPLRRRNRQAG
jgi:site-specific recombinase XerC